MGLEKQERISDDALARMLKEAVQTPYRRGGWIKSGMKRIAGITYVLEYQGSNKNGKVKGL